MTINVGDAVDLFSMLFNLSIWAVGFIMVAYMLAILRILGQKVKEIRLGAKR
jgi:hypothetical protein